MYHISVSGDWDHTMVAAVLSRIHWDRSDAVYSPASIGLMNYWRELGGTVERAPPFSSFQLMDIYQFASQIFIRDRVEEGNEFRVRFIGTKVTEWIGKELTGKLVSESFKPEAAASLLKAFQICAAEVRPVRAVGYADFVLDREHWNFEAIYLPLLGSGDSVDYVVGAVDYKYRLRDGDLPTL
jgi:hypothetical protein